MLVLACGIYPPADRQSDRQSKQAGRQIGEATALNAIAWQPAWIDESAGRGGNGITGKKHINH